MPRRDRSPSLAQDLLTLGDIYLTLGWMAIQRLRHGALWPWDTRSHRPAPIATLRPPADRGLEERETAARKRD